jgi:hypothetical protein
MAKNPKWTKEEDNFLISFYKTEEKDYIMKNLPIRNWYGITIRANKLGLHRMNYFTTEEIDFIKNNRQSMDSIEIGLYLNRSSDVIKNKSIELGLCVQENWTEEERNILINNFGIYDIEYISKNLLKNRTKSSIYHQCQILKISKNNIKYEKETLLALLKELSEKLGRTPLCSELAFYGVPSAYIYLKYFGGYNNACEILDLDINATIFNQTKYYYSKNNDVCRSKAEQIITNFLIDNKIDYIMDKQYNSICNVGCPGKKRYDWLLKDNIVVEYFGLNRNKKYQEKMKFKIELCLLNNIELIQIFDKDILKLENVFKKFIKVENP